jgi:hypothetical protein
MKNNFPLLLGAKSMHEQHFEILPDFPIKTLLERLDRLTRNLNRKNEKIIAAFHINGMIYFIVEKEQEVTE